MCMHMHSHMHMHTYTCIHTYMHALSPLKIHHLHFWLSIYHQRCHFACHLVGYSGVIVTLLLLPFQRALPHYLSLIWHVYPCPLSHLVRRLRHWHRYCLIHILVWNTPQKNNNLTSRGQGLLTISGKRITASNTQILGY